MPSVLAVCVVRQLRPDAGSDGVTAIDKAAVSGPIRVGPLGLRGDVQVSRKHHGGPDKALYIYSQSDAEFWEAHLSRALPPGWFGENLRIEGLDVNTASVGDRWRIGQGSSAVEVELTMPRSPCQTFARWVGGPEQRGWVRRFAAQRRFGAYARVLSGGFVHAGDQIESVYASPHSMTIADAFVGS